MNEQFSSNILTKTKLVTGALWKVSTDENIDRLVEMGLVPTLIRLLIDNSDALDDLQFNPLKINVLTNVVGAIAESAKSQVTIVFSSRLGIPNYNFKKNLFPFDHQNDW